MPKQLYPSTLAGCAFVKKMCPCSIFIYYKVFLIFFLKKLFNINYLGMYSYSSSLGLDQGIRIHASTPAAAKGIRFAF